MQVPGAKAHQPVVAVPHPLSSQIAAATIASNNITEVQPQPLAGCRAFPRPPSSLPNK